MMISAASQRSARAMATACRWPPDRTATGAATSGSARAARHRALIQQQPAGSRDLGAEEDVLRDRQTRRQREFLIDRGDAVPQGIVRRGEGDDIAAQTHGALAWRLRAGDDLYQARFARPVVAAECQHFTGPDRQIDAAHRLHGPIGFADSVQRQQRVGHGLKEAVWRCPDRPALRP
jgi:hypothetical protein